MRGVETGGGVGRGDGGVSERAGGWWWLCGLSVDVNGYGEPKRDAFMMRHE
jgi:hypothetical protein